MTTPALIIDLGGKFDQGFNQSAFEGAERWVAETGGTYDPIELQSEAQRLQVLRVFAERDNSPVVTLGFANITAVDIVAQEYPATDFAIIDSIVDQPNVGSYTFDVSEGAFIAGVIAAAATVTGTVGFVGGMDIPLSRAYADAFAAGVEATRPGTTVIVNMTGTTPAAWNDPVKGGALANAQMLAGADIIYSPAGGTALGVLQAVDDYTGGTVYSIGADINLNGRHPGSVLTSVVKEIGAVVEHIFENGITPDTNEWGFDEGGWSYAVDTNNASIFTDEIKAAADAAIANFISSDPNAPMNMIGGDDPDPLTGAEGNDSLVGNGGNDTLRGLGGEDTLEGGDDDDRLEGGQGSDSLDGGDQNDELFGGGSGEDTLIGGRGSDFLFGENGDDLLEGGDGFDLLNGGTDDDTLLGGNGNDRLLGNLGNDSLEGDAGNDTLFGGPSGNDILKGGDNDDQLFGETGRDILVGDDGDDTLNGGSNDDTLLGGNGDDSLEGGSGNDQLFGGPTGADTLKGGQGSDFLFAESANDLLEGGDGFDLMNGGAGDDVMRGGNGGDQMVGNLGNDVIEGDAGDDNIFGSAGNDTITGGTGNDTLRGELGADTFIFEDGFGVDEIVGFQLTGGDVVDLALVSGITSFADLENNHLSQDGADAVITDGVNTIRLVGIDENDLAAGDFDFGV